MLSSAFFCARNKMPVINERGQVVRRRRKKRRRKAARVKKATPRVGKYISIKHGLNNAPVYGGPKGGVFRKKGARKLYIPKRSRFRVDFDK